MKVDFEQEDVFKGEFKSFMEKEIFDDLHKKYSDKIYIIFVKNTIFSYGIIDILFQKLE